MQSTAKIQDIYTLTPMQEGMLFHTLYDEKSSGYFQQISYRIYGDLEVEVVKKSLAFLFQRHEILRTSFIHQNTRRPVQVVLRERKPEIYDEDLRRLHQGQEHAKEELIQKFKAKDKERSFDLTRDVLLRLTVLRLDNKEYEVIWSFHHILLDAWSTGILISEFFTIYSELVKGKTPQLPHVKPYRDYIQWLEAQDKKKSRDYWHQFLEEYREAVGIPRLKPVRTRGGVYKAYKNAALYFFLDKDVTSALNHLASENQLSVSTLLQVLWGGLLGKYNRKQDAVFGAVVSGRPAEIQGVETMVGLFINTIPIRITFEEKTPFIRLAGETQQKYLESEPYHFVPLAEIQSQSFLKQHLIDHLFIFENFPMAERIEGLLEEKKTGNQPIGFEASKVDVFEQTNYDFNLYIAPAAYLNVKIAYNEYIYQKELVEKISRSFKHLVEQVLENPAVTIQELTILSEQERNQVLYEFNNTAMEYPSATPIHELFQREVEKNPGHVALVFKEKHLTYRELDLRSNKLAAILQEKRIGFSSIVGVMTERSLEMLVGMMAVLKAGAAYLPLDPAFPRERIQYMLQESNTALVLSLGEIPLDRGISFNGEILDLKNPQLYRGMDTALKNPMSSSRPAYIIYTSGSTGKPKGVMVEHRNVVNFIRGIVSRIPFSPGKAILALTTISFDIFVLETFLPLLNSLKVVIADEGNQRDPVLLGDVIVKHRLNMLQVTPSTMHMLLSSDIDLHCLKGLEVLMVGGEAFPDYLFAALKETFKGRIYNMYGPTETTVWSAVKDLTLEETVDIGTPIANTRVFIVDNYDQLLPVGAAGELCIGGDGVARGYLNRPGLTAEKFILPSATRGSFEKSPLDPTKLLLNYHSPLSSHHSPIYKTGDLARWLLDGNIQFLGRIDQQVKVRGFRIELGEIESRLLGREDIKEAVVVIKEDNSADKYICAYIVPHQGNTLSDMKLREYLAVKLPYYMIPSYIIQLEQIPLTPNGKIDRNALPTPGIKESEAGAVPRNEFEERLVGIWSEVLGITREKMGIDHNFFQVGGHSLKAVIMASGIHKEFNVTISLVEFFKRPTIRQLGEYIKKMKFDRFIAVEPSEKMEYYPLSSGQKRLLFLQQLEEAGTAYNMTAVMEWYGVVDRERLERTFRQLIARHESFRTSFHMIDGQPVQRVHPGVKFEIESNDKPGDHIDLKDFIRPFDLEQAPLLRVGLMEISQGRNLLLVDMHHIISDGVSVHLAVQDFVRFFAGEDLPPLRLQYKDYSQWQCGQQQKEILKIQREYWIGEFAGEVPVLLLPLDYPRPVLQSFEGGTVYFELSVEETIGIRGIAQKLQGTLYMTLLALYSIFLMKISGQEDIVVGSPVAGRRHKDLEQIIGNFVNTLALRNSLEGGISFKALLEKVKESILRAFDNQEYPYEDLIEEVGLKRDTGRNPLFDAALVLHNVDITGEIPPDSTGDVMIKRLPLEGKTSKFDLKLQVIEGREKIALDFEYCGKLFKPGTIRLFVEYFKEILKAVLHEPTILLREISVISLGAKQELLAAFNYTQVRYPGHQTIHRLFEDQAEKSPDHIAVQGNGLVTYRQLNEQSDWLAGLLIEKNVLTDSIVAIMIERSVEMIIGLLGILKSGGAYLPIDPDYPQERIDYMLKDSGAHWLVTANDREVKEVRRWEGVKVLIEDISKSSKRSSYLLNSSNLAYVIYTSGSTGKPKGTMIEHGNVVRLFFHEGCLFDFSGRDTWTMFHSYCFDFSVWEMYGALLFGGQLIVVPKITAREPVRFLELLELKAVTVLNQTPSAFYALEAVELARADKKLHLRYVIFGGEALHPIKLEKWREKYTGTRLINMFGITETTVHVTYRELSEEDIRQDVRHIGRPIPTMSTYVVDRYQQLQPAGIVGEIYVGGGGVARGYLNRLDLTAERFVENPFEPGKRSYRSGDIVKITDDRDMEYLGRIDQQVQIRGFRVELGEIETQMLQYPLVKEAYVMERTDSTGDIYLCAYIVVEKEKKPDTAELRQFLTSRLPEYMVPSFFVQLEAFPMTVNGKVDRRALPVPIPGEGGKNFIAPRNDREWKLVEIWAKLLGLDKNRIGIDDNFFELGGHSLKAGLLAAVVHKEMEVKLPLPEIFITPHIRGLAEYIGKAVKEKYLSIEPTKKKDYYALSSAQRRLYIMQHVDPSITAYNITPIYSVRGPLDKEKLETTFQQLIRRHESLRTSFSMFAGEPSQEIHENVEFQIEWSDCTAEVSAAMDNFVRPFDLQHAPLLRVGLIKVKEEEHILMIDMHHIITDGVSANILVRDFAALYGGKSLPELKLQYKDFSEWQNSDPVKKEMARQREYWLNRFAGPIPRLNLATDYERSETKTFAGGSIDFVIGKELNLRVKKLIQETGTSIFMFLLAAYNVLLFRYSKQEDIMVGSPITGRRHADLQQIVGMFVNMLVYRNHPANHKTFKKFLEEVKQNALQAYENQDYQFEHLIVDLNLQGTADRNPLFDAVFSMQKIDLDKGENVGEDYYKGIEHLQITPYSFKTQTTPFELLMSAYDTDDAIIMTLGYAARLFKPSTAEKISRHYEEVIRQVVEYPDIELQNIRLSHQLKQLMDVDILEDQEDFGF